MTPNLRLLLAATVVSSTLHTVAAGADPKWTVAGALEGSARYNSNLTLLSADGPVEPKSAFLTEFNGRLSASRTLGAWRGDSQVNGLANVHASLQRKLVLQPFSATHLRPTRREPVGEAALPVPRQPLLRRPVEYGNHIVSVGLELRRR